MKLPGYLIEERLSVAPRQALHRATRDRDGCAVLVRVPDPGLGEDDRARLRRSWELARRLDVAGLQRPDELIEQGHRPCVVMAIPEGESLRARLRRGRLEPLEALDVAGAIAKILQELHSRRVVHGELSPDHVLVTADGGVRLLAFAPTPERHHDLPPGTDATAWRDPAYVAPEQTGRMDHPVDARTDLYALGVLLFEMLTGTPPFEGDDVAALLHGHLAIQPWAPHEVHPDVPEPLSALVSKLRELAADVGRQRGASGPQWDPLAWDPDAPCYCGSGKKARNCHQRVRFVRE
ncbi:MAG: protein kinase domain-containing protein, partial [Myxococcota bacterium]